MAPPKLQLFSSSQETSEDENLSQSVENPNQAATKAIEIEEESSPSDSPIEKSPIRKTYAGESSKILKPPTQAEMNAMLEAVHKLIGEMTKKTSQPPLASSVPIKTIASPPHIGSTIPSSSLARGKPYSTKNFSAYHHF